VLLLSSVIVGVVVVSVIVGVCIYSSTQTKR